MTQPNRPTIRLSSPGDIAIAIPMLLGFHPKESIVVSCVRGPSVELTMRFDLTDLMAPDFVDELADRIRIARADVTVLAVFTGDQLPGGALPYAADIERLYADERLRVVDAVLVRRRRWWSYLCPDPVCCPAGGRPLDDSSPVATSLSAAFALSGSGVLADREALVDALAFDDEADVVALRRRLSSARRRVEAMGQAGRLSELRVLSDALVARFEDPRSDAKDVEVARLAALLHDVTARDELLVQAVPPRRREALLRVLLSAVRRVPSPEDTPICTALAWFAYADGDGTTANIALERALRSDPEYSLALLIAASLDRQLPPAALVEVMQGAVRDIRARDAAG